MIILRAIKKRFGYWSLAGSLGVALVSLLILLALPWHPLWLLLVPRLLFSVVLVLSVNLAIVIAQLLFARAPKAHLWREDSSAMLWPQPVYEHLYRTRMPRELKGQVKQNRAEETEKIKQFLQGDARMLVIHGEAGVGKSTLAALETRRIDFWLHLHFRDYSLRDLLFHISSWLETPAITNALLQKEELDPCVIPSLVSIISRGDHRLVFNGFDHLLDAEGRFIDTDVARFFSSLIAAEGSHKLILCCSKLPWFCRDSGEAPAPWHLITLEPLGLAATGDLVEQGYDTDDQAFIQRLHQATDGNPLLIKVLLPRLVRGDAADLLEEVPWKGSPDSLINPSFLEQLARPHFAVLQKMALVPEPLTKSFINTLQSDSAGDAAAHLAERELIVWDGGMKRYHMHHEIIASVLESMPEGSQARRQAFNELGAICLKKARDYKPPEKWTSISDCRLYMHALGIYLRLGDTRQSAAILYKLLPHLERWHDRLLLIRYFQRLVHLFEIREDTADDVDIVIRSLKTLAGLYIEAGRSNSALPLLESLSLFGRLERNRVLLSFANGKKVEALLDLGNVEQAEKLAARLVNSARSTPLLAAQLARLGHAQKRAGDIPAAVHSYHQSSVLFKRSGHDQALLKSIEYLSEAHVLNGQYAHAHDLLEKLIRKPQVRQDFERKLRAQRLRASCYLGLGDSGKAILLLQESAEAAREKELPQYVISMHSALAKLYSDEGNHPAAITHLEQLIDSARKYGDFHNLALGHARLAKLFLEMTRLEDAATNVMQAIEYFSLCDSTRMREKSEALLSRIQKRAEEL